MNDENNMQAREEEVVRLVREIGQPLPDDLKERIMNKVHERAIELSRTPKPEQVVKPHRERSRKRGMQP